jgi:cobalamin synthase
MKFMKYVITMLPVFTKIPVPKLNRELNNLKYVIAVFPFTGAVIGAVLYV